MRAVSRLDGDKYRDMSTAGMRVGTGTSESRIAVFKPAFTTIVEPWKGWTVSQVDYKIGSTMVELHEVEKMWSGASPPREIYSLPKTEITTEYLIQMFQSQLNKGGNYAATPGVFLSGDSPLASSNEVNIEFAVTIIDPSPFTVEAIALEETASNTALFSWRSSRRGYAEIWVNGSERIRDQFTVANKTNRNTIWSDWLQSGENEVFVRVTEPEDLQSVAESDILTVSF